LPELAEALRSAKLNRSVVRELSRVAVPETEHEWILAARRKTARQVERMVSGLAPGDRPAARRRPELVRHILRLEVGAETLATFREAIRELRKRSDHRLDDDAALLLMAREVLFGPGDAGRASYQLVVTQCEDCGRGSQHASGELVELDPAIVEMCHCDAQNIPIAHSHSIVADAPDSHVADAAQTHAHLTNSEDVAPVFVAQRASNPRRPDDPVQPGTHVGPTEVSPNGGASLARLKRRRATQSTPPAMRREVFWRDRGRCVVPGCRNTTYLDIHHLNLRSEGGGNEADNLMLLCGAHHNALHRGRLRMDGKVSTGLRVHHADGTAYGFMPSPLIAEASARAFAGLRNLGFPRERRAPASNRRCRPLPRTPRQRHCCAPPLLAPAAPAAGRSKDSAALNKLAERSADPCAQSSHLTARSTPSREASRRAKHPHNLRAVPLPRTVARSPGAVLRRLVRLLGQRLRSVD
jgi:hypothetical protein